MVPESQFVSFKTKNKQNPKPTSGHLELPNVTSTRSVNGTADLQFYSDYNKADYRNKKMLKIIVNGTAVLQYISIES